MQQSDTQLTLSPVMPAHIFRWLLLLAIVSFSSIWSIDLSSGIISTFDAASYPICIAAFILVLAVSFIRTINFALLHFVTYCVVAGYLISSSAWHHTAENAVFSNSTQWLGLNYVIAYLFLDVKKAAPTTIIVFIVTIGAHFAAVIQHNTVSETFGVLANIAVANAIYMVLLWTVLKMRVKGELIQQNARALESYANIDPLTKIRNRRSIEKHLDNAHQRWQQKRLRYSIIMMDIDYFKSINDLYGHLEGDQVLMAFAQALSDKVPTNTILARWGGEEFLLLVPEYSQKEAFELAENIRQSIEQTSLALSAKVTMSVGVGHCEEAERLADLLSVADHNLYAAKHAGRNITMDSTLAEALTRQPNPDPSTPISS